MPRLLRERGRRHERDDQDDERQEPADHLPSVGGTFG